jgi:chaperonin GroES
MADLKLVPLGDRVIVEPIEQEEMTPSGIVLPETAKEKPQRGRVIAAGPGRMEEGKRQPLDVAPGDVVVYKKWGGDEFKVNDKKYMILSENDILAKLVD